MSGNEGITEGPPKVALYENCSQPESSSKKAVIIVAIEIILGGAVVLGAVYFAHMHGIGTIGLLLTGTGGAVLVAAMAILTAYCISKKKPSIDHSSVKSVNDQPSSSSLISASPASKTLNIITTPPNDSSEKPLIKGELRIYSNYLMGAVGKNLRSSDFERLQKIKRVDGQNWMREEELLVMCEMDVTPESTLQKKSQFPLPLSLFYKDDCYEKLKEEGEVVEFYYEDQRYELSIVSSTLKGTKTVIPFTEGIIQCEKKFKKENGPTFYEEVHQSGKMFEEKEQTQNLHPRVICEGKKLAEKFYAIFINTPNLPKLKHPLQLYGTTSSTFFRITMPTECKLEFTTFYSETSFAVYAKSEDEKEYLWVKDYKEIDTTREKIEKGVLNTNIIQLGFYEITYPK